MGKIHTTFNYSAAAVFAGAKTGVTPEDIMQAFGQLPGNTTIDSITLAPNPSPTSYSYRVVANNDLLPDGTEITIKYARDGYTDPFGAYKTFDRFDGIFITIPHQPTRTYSGNANPPTIPPLVPFQTNHSSSPYTTGNGVFTVPHGLKPYYTINGIKATVTQPAITNCSCGSSKIGSPNHSSWCDTDEELKE